MGLSVTIFNGAGNGKIPYSKSKDLEFLFVNKECQNLKECMLYLVDNYALSRHLNIGEPVKSKRRIIDLKPYFCTNLNNIIIDIDEVHNKEDYSTIIDYFRVKNYSIILWKSRSNNGKDNFNMKGIIKVQLENISSTINALLASFQKDLGSTCVFDLSAASNIVSSQSPSFNNFIIYYQEKGIILNDFDIDITDIKDSLSSKPDIVYNNTIVDKAMEIFYSLGFKTDNTINGNNSINFNHPNEKKSKNGYFWFASNPFIMNHHNKQKSVSIFNIIKDTDEGKEFLRNKTKEDQRSQLIQSHNIFNYEEYIMVNERYLDFEDKQKIDIIYNFMNSDKGLLKIKSAMGSAKSSGVELIIKEANKRNEKVILVSNRVSVAEDFSQKYNLMLYKHPNSHLHKGSIVVQYDSLHRFDLSIYDIVVFDEFVSLILHHRANLTDNANINAVKFNILTKNKRVVVADAFLTGYEDIFFKNKKIYAILNEYKDDVVLYEYKNKEFFISSLLKTANDLGLNEHISCSFTSLNVMRVVEKELIDMGIRVISLSSETSQLTRDLIYSKFKEESHNSFQVILFTPTLTVGVSNLNNIVSHFHYDSSMSTDVVSSLQMIKRSRTAREIHFYISERQFYYDTSYDSLNSIAEKNINSYYNKKDKTLLVDVDYNTGNLVLTPLAKYINTIEVFYNILENNHANAFKILLDYQFKNSPIIISNIDNGFNLVQKVKNVKEELKLYTMNILEEYSDTTWNSMELEEIRRKSIDKTREEKAKLIMGGIQERFKSSIPQSELVELARIEVDNDYNFISRVKNMNTVIYNDNNYTRYILSSAITKDISSLQNKKHIEFLEYSLKMNTKLRSSYSRVDIENQDNVMKIGSKFEKFLKKLGYKWGEALLRVDERVIKYLKYIN